MKKLRTALSALILLACALALSANAQGAAFERNPNGTGWGISVPFTPDSRADYTFELYLGSSATDALPENLLDRKEGVTASPVFLEAYGFDPSIPGTVLWLRVSASVDPCRQGLDTPGMREQKITLSGGCGCTGLSSYEQPFYYGDGTEKNPFLVSTPQQLQHLNNGRHLQKGQYFLQTCDIDLRGYDSDGDPANGNWRPIGYTVYPYDSGYFTGHYDGNGHLVQNMSFHLTLEENTAGVFGAIQSSTIENLGVVSGEILTDSDIGGVVGTAINSHIACCYADVNITGSTSDPMGGPVVSTLYDSTIENCCGRGNISSSVASGGIAGAFWGGTNTIRNCYSLATLQSTRFTGGIVARLNTGLSYTMDGCYWLAGPLYAEGSGGVTPSGNYRLASLSDFESGELFPGWDTDVWQFEAGKAPQLRVFLR